MTDAGEPQSIWRPLARPLFRGVWIAAVASHIGSYMTDVGQGWLMSSLTPSPLIVSLLLTAESIPFFLLGLPAGALADIVDRRRLLLVTQIAMAAIVSTLAIATLTGNVTPAMLLVIAFALGIATALNDPAWHSVVPELLPKDELSAGVTLNAVGINVARSLGPALGGFIVAAFGPGVVFVLDALSFFGVVATVFAWKRERTRSVLPAERLLGAIRGGMRFAWNSDALRRVLLSTLAFMSCGSGIMALMPILARETGRGAIGYGLLLGSLGCGAVFGATLLPRMRTKLSPQRLVFAGFVVFAGVAFAESAIHELLFLCPILFAGGIAWIAVLSTLNVAAQEASPPWVRARALAVFLIVLQAGIAGGSVAWGTVALRAGLPAACVWIGIGLVIGALFVLRWRPAAARAEDHTPAHHWEDPVVAGELPLDAGPIMVQVEYTVDALNAEPFRIAMNEVGRSRRQSGAIAWWLFHDTADPTRFVETWIESTWAEHLRYHDRVSVAHKSIEQRALVFLRSGTRASTRHFVAPVPRPPENAVLRAVEDRACR